MSKASTRACGRTQPRDTVAGMKFTKEQAARVFDRCWSIKEASDGSPIGECMWLALNEVFADLPAPAPQPAPKTPGQVAYEASCCWAEEDPADRARWEAIAQAVLAAAGGRS